MPLFRKSVYNDPVIKLSDILIGLVALIHIWFLFFEMFLWRSKLARDFFKVTDAQLEATQVLAANQGLYNAFLGVGLMAAYLVDDSVSTVMIQQYILGCVVVAGIYGALSADKKIFFVQALPAFIAFVLSWAGF